MCLAFRILGLSGVSLAALTVGALSARPIFRRKAFNPPSFTTSQRELSALALFLYLTFLCSSFHRDG